MVQPVAFCQWVASEAIWVALAGVISEVGQWTLNILSACHRNKLRPRQSVLENKIDSISNQHDNSLGMTEYVWKKLLGTWKSCHGVSCSGGVYHCCDPAPRILTNSLAAIRFSEGKSEALCVFFWLLNTGGHGLEPEILETFHVF